MNTFRENILKVKRSLDPHFGIPNPQSRYTGFHTICNGKFTKYFFFFL